MNTWERYGVGGVRASDGSTIKMSGGLTRGFAASETLIYRDGKSGRELTIVMGKSIPEEETHSVEVSWSKIEHWDPPHNETLISKEESLELKEKILLGLEVFLPGSVEWRFV